jgi:hypothetical protein
MTATHSVCSNSIHSANWSTKSWWTMLTSHESCCSRFRSLADSLPGGYIRSHLRQIPNASPLQALKDTASIIVGVMILSSRQSPGYLEVVLYLLLSRKCSPCNWFRSSLITGDEITFAVRCKVCNFQMLIQSFSKLYPIFAGYEKLHERFLEDKPTLRSPSNDLVVAFLAINCGLRG